MPGFAWRKEEPGVMPRARKYPVELLERGTRLVFESGRPIAHVAADLGVPSETLRKYVRQVEANEGRRADLMTSEEREEIRKLRREVFERRGGGGVVEGGGRGFSQEGGPGTPRRGGVAGEGGAALGVGGRSTPRSA